MCKMGIMGSRFVKHLLSGMGLTAIMISLLLPLNVLPSEALTYDTFCNAEVTDGSIPYPVDPDAITYDPDNNTIYLAVVNDTQDANGYIRIEVYACTPYGVTLHSTISTYEVYDVFLYYYRDEHKLYMLVHPPLPAGGTSLSQSEILVYNGTQGYAHVSYINDTGRIDKFMIDNYKVYIVGQYVNNSGVYYAIWISDLSADPIPPATVISQSTIQIDYAADIDVDDYGTLYMILNINNTDTGVHEYYIYKYDGTLGVYRYLGDEYSSSWSSLVVYNNVPYAAGFDSNANGLVLVRGTTDTFSIPENDGYVDLVTSSNGVDVMVARVYDTYSGSVYARHYWFNGSDFILQATLYPNPSYPASLRESVMFAYDNVSEVNYVILVQEELEDQQGGSTIGTGLYSWHSTGPLNTTSGGGGSSGNVVILDNYVVYGNSSHGYSVVAAYQDRFDENLFYAVAASYDYDSSGNLLPDTNGVALFMVNLTDNNVTLLFEEKYTMEPLDAAFYEYNDSSRIYRYFYVVGRNSDGNASYMLLNATSSTVTYSMATINGLPEFIEAIGFEFYNASSNRNEYVLYAVLDNGSLGKITGFEDPGAGISFTPEYTLPSNVVSEPQRIFDKSMYGYSIIAFIASDTVTGKGYGVLVQNLSTTSLTNVTDSVDYYNSNYTYLSVNDIVDVRNGSSVLGYYIAVGNMSGGILLQLDTVSNPPKLTVSASDSETVFMSLKLYDNLVYIAGSSYNTSSGNIDVNVLEYNVTGGTLSRVAWGDVSGANDYAFALLQVYPEYRILGKSIASPPKLAYLYTTAVTPIPEPWAIQAIVLSIAIVLLATYTSRRK